MAQNEFSGDLQGYRLSGTLKGGPESEWETTGRFRIEDDGRLVVEARRLGAASTMAVDLSLFSGNVAKEGAYRHYMVPYMQDHMNSNFKFWEKGARPIPLAQVDKYPWEDDSEPPAPTPAQHPTEPPAPAPARHPAEPAQDIPPPAAPPASPLNEAQESVPLPERRIPKDYRYEPDHRPGVDNTPWSRNRMAPDFAVARVQDLLDTLEGLVKEIPAGVSVYQKGHFWEGALEASPDPESKALLEGMGDQYGYSGEDGKSHMDQVIDGLRGYLEESQPNTSFLNVVSNYLAHLCQEYREAPLKVLKRLQEDAERHSASLKRKLQGVSFEFRKQVRKAVTHLFSKAVPSLRKILHGNEGYLELPAGEILVMVGRGVARLLEKLKDPDPHAVSMYSIAGLVDLLGGVPKALQGATGKWAHEVMYWTCETLRILDADLSGGVSKDKGDDIVIDFGEDSRRQDRLEETPSDSAPYSEREIGPTGDHGAPGKGTLLSGVAADEDGQEVTLNRAQASGRHVNHYGNLYVEYTKPDGKKGFIAWHSFEGVSDLGGTVHSHVPTYEEHKVPTTPVRATIPQKEMEKLLRSFKTALLSKDMVSGVSPRPLWVFTRREDVKDLHKIAFTLGDVENPPDREVKAIERACMPFNSEAMYDEERVKLVAALLSATRTLYNRLRLPSRVKEPRPMLASLFAPGSVQERVALEGWDKALVLIHDTVKEMMDRNRK